jgi:uncharacterized membrane protein
MVLELKVPHGSGIAALAPLWPVFLSYVLSFVYIGIYWNNHHHMLQLTRGWMGENHLERGPTILYGVNLLLCAVAYTVLQAWLVAPWAGLAFFLGVALIWLVPDPRIEKRIVG